MASTLTHFEVELPLQTDGSAGQTAITTFMNNMITLCPIYNIEMYKFINDGSGHATSAGQSNFMSGYITAAQQSTALGYLNALNAALGTPVLCTIHTVTTEP